MVLNSHLLYPVVLGPRKTRVLSELDDNRTAGNVQRIIREAY